MLLNNNNKNKNKKNNVRELHRHTTATAMECAPCMSSMSYYCRRCRHGGGGGEGGGGGGSPRLTSRCASCGRGRGRQLGRLDYRRALKIMKKRLVRLALAAVRSHVRLPQPLSQTPTCTLQEPAPSPSR